MTGHRDSHRPAIGLETARQVLAAQPFSGLLGARLATFSPGLAVLEVPVRRELTQQNGFLHGGVLAYAADNAITFAGGSVLGPRVLTGGITITYLRPAAGELLEARATVVDAGRRQAVCRCELVVHHGDRSVLCAAAQGTVVLVGASGEDSEAGRSTG
ncbi:MAG: PaaI family thioesterase [Micromonospora sp.]